jgi:hypothetical protein
MKWVVLVLVAACGHAPAAPPPPPAPPASCERIADHLVGMIGESTKATPEQLDPFRRVIATRCTHDRWSDQAQHCLLAAPTLDDGNQCDPLFTPEQKQALAKDGQDALAAMPQPTGSAK